DELDRLGERSDQAGSNLVAVANTNGTVVEVTAADVELNAFGNLGADGAAETEVGRVGTETARSSATGSFTRESDLEHVEGGFTRHEAVPVTPVAARSITAAGSQSCAQLEGIEGAGHASVDGVGVTDGLDAIEQATDRAADVSGNAVAGVVEHTDQRTSLVVGRGRVGTVQSLETELTDEAFAEAGLDLDHVTALADRAFPDALVGVIRDEQAGEVERLVIAFVEDRTLAASADDGGVTDLNVGVFEAHTVRIRVTDVDAVAAAVVVAL